MRCPYCTATQGRCATTSSGRSITECSSCGRVVEERQTQPRHLFHIRAHDSPLCLVTSDLPTLPVSATASSASNNDDEDPFEPTGFITAFSTWSLEPYPVFAQSTISFAGHLAELERVLETTSSSSNPSSPSVVVDNLRAYLQIIDVASILGLECDISDHAFQLFRDCSSATCLRNRSVEALATAALVQAIREAQEPRTLQEISLAANLPQKEIGKYIKILGEALQLSQPINSNSISVHMPRFCTLLQLNKSAQELATHIGEVVMNKCFCTRRNPISISAAAIYLACQLEDKRKTQAEICKVTGLTEVTLRKVYKELLENWDDLLPSNYNPAVPPEKAFPTATIASGRTSNSRADIVEATSSERDKQAEAKMTKPMDGVNVSHLAIGQADSDRKDNVHATQNTMSWPPSLPKGPVGSSNERKIAAQKNQNVANAMEIDSQPKTAEENKVDTNARATSSSARPYLSSQLASGAVPVPWPPQSPISSRFSPSSQFMQPPMSSRFSPSSQFIQPPKHNIADKETIKQDEIDKVD